MRLNLCVLVFMSEAATHSSDDDKKEGGKNLGVHFGAVFRFLFKGNSEKSSGFPLVLERGLAAQCQ